MSRKNKNKQQEHHKKLPPGMPTGPGDYVKLRGREDRGWLGQLAAGFPKPAYWVWFEPSKREDGEPTLCSKFELEAIPYDS